jgi:hypothetical protein
MPMIAFTPEKTKPRAQTLFVLSKQVQCFDAKLSPAYISKKPKILSVSNAPVKRKQPRNI